MSFLDTIPAPVKWIVGTALVVVFLIFAWLFLTRGMNAVKDFVFWRQANQKQQEVNTKLAKAEEQQKALDITLQEYAKSKEALAAAKKESEIREKIFNDNSKTASQKVAAYKDALSAAPTVTDPVGVSTDDLCQRAKAIGGSSQLIAALCPEG